MRPDDGLATKVRQFRYSLRYVVNVHPAIYMPLARRWHADLENRFVERDTELVIEGFGRSGSSFAVIAFELAQERPVKTAHHTHAAAQVIAGAKMGIPTLVIVRDASEATLAHMVRRGIHAKPALESWIRYHEHVLPYRDRIVATSLSTVSTDLGSVLGLVNERFGTSFEEFDHTEANQAQVFEIIEARNLDKYGKATYWVARPTAARIEEKEALRRELENPRLAGLWERAGSLHRALIPSTIPP